MSSETYFPASYLEILKTYGFVRSSLVALICVLPVIYLLRRQKFNLPPGPVGLPFLGYFPFLGKQPYKTLRNVSEKYGNVFSLYFGRTLLVVLGDYPALKEALSKPATVNRPEGIFDFMPDGMGLASFNGEKWVDQRRLVKRTMKDIGFGRSAFQYLIEDEISEFLKLISNQKGAPLNFGKCLERSMANNTASLVFGKRHPPGPQADTIDSGVEAIMESFKLNGAQTIWPWLSSVFVKLRIGKYCKLHSEMVAFNSLIRKEIEIHKNAKDDSVETDFVFSYLKATENTDTATNEKDLIANTEALFSGATDTTKASLMWLFLAMAAYPDIQRKVHEELDSVLGRDQKPTWDGHLELPYTYAVITEAQRWRTVVPFALPRIASEDFELCGYDVPKGTFIIPNLWAIHNDLRYWKDPERFIPERFLEKDGKDINLKLESYAPFSYGRRRCPGEMVAQMSIFLYFTSVMQHFEIRIPNDAKPNLDGKLGVTYTPLVEDLCGFPR